MSRFKLAIDIGGTFVDLVVYDQKRKSLSHFKVPTTPMDPAQAVLNGVDSIQVPLSEIGDFMHGTTLGLNAILERKGANVGIITNKGFEDIFLIGRGSLNFVDMYRFDFEQLPSLVRRRNIRGVNGRINFLGQEIDPLDEKAVLEAAHELINNAVESNLHAFAFGRGIGAIFFTHIEPKHNRIRGARQHHIIHRNIAHIHREDI